MNKLIVIITLVLVSGCNKVDKYNAGEDPLQALNKKLADHSNSLVSEGEINSVGCKWEDNTYVCVLSADLFKDYAQRAALLGFKQKLNGVLAKNNGQDLNYGTREKINQKIWSIDSCLQIECGKQGEKKPLGYITTIQYRWNEHNTDPLIYMIMKTFMFLNDLLYQYSFVLKIDKGTLSAAQIKGPLPQGVAKELAQFKNEFEEYRSRMKSTDPVEFMFTQRVITAMTYEPGVTP